MSKSAHFIDFHGTLSDFRFWERLDSQIFNRIQTQLFSNIGEDVRAWMRGDLACRHVFRRVSQISNISPSEVYHMAIDPEEILLSAGIVDAVCELRKLSTVFLISDNMPHLVRVFRAQKLHQLFDDVWFSCEHGSLKNEKGGVGYRTLLTKHKLHAQDCTLLDDSSSAVRTFRKLGGAAFQMRGPDDVIKYVDAKVASTTSGFGEDRPVYSG